MVYESLSSYITTGHSLLISSLEFSHLAWDHWFTLRILKSDKLILKGKYSWWRWIWVYLLNGPLMAVKKTISNLWVWTWHYRVYNFVMVIYLFLWWYHLEFNFLNLFSLGIVEIEFTVEVDAMCTIISGLDFLYTTLKGTIVTYSFSSKYLVK